MTTRRLWGPVLAALLVAALVGPAGGVVTAAEPRVTTRTISIPVAAFNPTTGGLDFTSQGYGLWLNAGSGTFVAPLFFEAPVVTIKRITFYGWDNSTSDMCLSLYREAPATSANELMGQVCSTGAMAGDRTFTLSALFPRRIPSGTYGGYLEIHLPGSSASYVFSGAKITYTF
jgi:hypothetical protein